MGLGGACGAARRVRVFPLARVVTRTGRLYVQRIHIALVSYTLVEPSSGKITVHRCGKACIYEGNKRRPLALNTGIRARGGYR